MLTDHSSYLEYRKIFESANSDPEVRAIVLSGVGKHFCAGLDLINTDDVLTSIRDGSRRGIKLLSHIAEFQDCIGASYNISKRKNRIVEEAHEDDLLLKLDRIHSQNGRIFLF